MLPGTLTASANQFLVLYFTETTLSPALLFPIQRHWFTSIPSGKHLPQMSGLQRWSYQMVVFHFLIGIFSYLDASGNSLLSRYAPLDLCSIQCSSCRCFCCILHTPLARSFSDGMSLGISGTSTSCWFPGRAQHPYAPLPHAWSCWCSVEHYSVQCMVH